MLEKWASAGNGIKTGDGTEVGLFIPLPKDLAAQYPSLGEFDKSPPHVTFLYVGNCPKNRVPLFLRICQGTLSHFDHPIRAKIEPIDYFEHPDKGRRVAITPIRFDQDMGKLKELLRENLSDAGFEVLDSWPIYRPHVTLKYLEGFEAPFKGKVPSGAWIFNNLEVWGLPKVYRFGFLRGSQTKTAAKYVKKIPNPNGDAKPIYQYSDRHIKKRNERKDNRVDLINSVRNRLSQKVRRDIFSKDPQVRIPALAVACIDRTYERVGNATSAKMGHFGVTGWKKKHVTLNGNSAIFQYVGKSGVRQKKEIKDAVIVKALKEQAQGKKPADYLFSWKTPSGEEKMLTARAVNSYLESFGVTAKDLRGFHANREMTLRLKVLRKSGGPLPKDPKEREDLLKEEFKIALEDTSDIVGHKATTLRNQYLVSGLETKYLENGSIFKKLEKKATKTHTEKEDENIRSFVKPHPDIKPSRKDKKNRRIQEEDVDLDKEDRDLSLNYKKVAKKLNLFPII